MNDAETANAASSRTILFPPSEWAKLLRTIGEGKVIPVVGPELLCTAYDQKPAARLYDLWGQALAQQRGIDNTAYSTEEVPLLYRVVNQLLMQGVRHEDLGCDIHYVVSDPHWPLPEALLQLAEISDIPLYVTTTVDRLMEAALGQVRSRRDLVTSIAFKQGGDAVNNDLPGEFVPGSRPTVFHLFGATGMDLGGFAATEDALIEFSWALIDHDYAPKHLYDFLHGKTLLLLGCDFPDWLARFLIHALARKPEAQNHPYFVSECDQRGLREFLRRKGLFVAALAIRAQLEEARIDTWMDESGLEPGAEFQQVIRDNICRASFFLAVISRALDLESSNRPGRFVLREWKWAEDANLERSKEHCFLQPVVVDDTPPGARFIDPPFRDLHWTRSSDGRLPLEFIGFLKHGIRRFRSNAAGGGR